MRTELVKFRCSKEEKLLLMVLTKQLSQKKQGEKVSYSEVMRIAMYEYGKKELGEEKLNLVLKKGEPV